MNSSTAKEEAPSVPIEFEGQWIAWSSDHMRIVASGEHLADVHRQVEEKGEKDVWFDKVPSSKSFFGGAAFRA